MSKTWKGLKDRLSGRQGQNTVEYLLMLAVIVGIVLVLASPIKNFMTQEWSNISQKIGAATNSASGGGP